jgi:hypothetical protein
LKKPPAPPKGRGRWWREERDQERREEERSRKRIEVGWIPFRAIKK